MSMTASITITINQPVQRASAARGLDAVARRLRDLESDYNALGLSAEDALALGAAREAIAAILAAVDPHSSHHRPGHHLVNAVKHSEEVTY